MDGVWAKKRSTFVSGVRPAVRPPMHDNASNDRQSDRPSDRPDSDATFAAERITERSERAELTGLTGQSGMTSSMSAMTIGRGRYALYGEIASGGMATVHFGRLVGAVGFNRPVAIKRLHPQYAKDPEFRAMFLDEARLVSRIRHQNVVPTLDVVASEDELFLVMEYVSGESLWRLMKATKETGQRVPVHVAMTIASHVLHGLHAAHEAKSETGEPLHIVHRDVSPQNVLVGTDGAARVLDFGVARASARSETTRGGKVKGKLAYMSPEQLGGSPVTRKADIYAASVILWELLTGKRLFLKGDPQTVLIEKLFRGPPPLPSSISKTVPAALDEIVLRGLARDPRDRFSTAREMAIAIEGCGKLATMSAVGEWVEKLAHDALTARARTVAEFESCSLPVAQPSAPPPPMTDSGMTSIAPMTKHTTSAPMSASEAPAPERIPAVAWLEESTHFFASGRDRGPRKSLASLLEPDIDKLVGARVGEVLGMERAKLVFASAFAVVGFAASIAICVTAVRAVSGWMSRHASGDASGVASNGTPPAANPPSSATPSPRPAAAPPAQACPRGMVPIPGGKFFMGSDDDLPMERPAHNVTLSPYCMDVYEVTTEDYKACSDRGECKRAGTTNDWATITNSDHKVFDPLCTARDPIGRARHPINCVDWDMATTYCHARGARLPTEAEWEFSARSPDGRKYPWGDAEPTAKHLNACGRECVEWGKRNHVEEEAMYSADDGWPTTAPVGSFPEGRSRYGMQDIVGNVWEWTADWYAPYGAEPQVSPKGPPRGAERAIRGGGWNGAYAAWVRPTFRYREAPDKRSYGIGFRCAANQGGYGEESPK
jgi:formylglycine-generating enzyme required for sulfatase activity/serine/threonine protein kinase